MEYFEYGEQDPGFDVEEFLEESEENQKQWLEDAVERIELQLEEREAIFDKNSTELESKLDWYLERLKSAYRMNRDVEELKEKVDEFYELLREERVRHWRDSQELEKERRELLRELDELEDTDILDIL